MTLFLPDMGQPAVAQRCCSLLLTQIAAQAERHPDRPAVLVGTDCLDYATLEQHASRVAGYLKQHYGVGPEKVVGVSMARSPLMVVVLLAIFKASGAYVPIDPAYPLSRRRYMLEDSGALVCIGDNADRDAASEELGVPYVGAEAMMSSAMATTGDLPTPSSIPADQLAYIIYTSGSTGTPKGVEVEHGSLANLIAYHHGQYLGHGGYIRSGFLASPSFDASVWELWPFLAAGATLAIPPADYIVSPPELRRWVAEQGITHIFLTTPLAELFLAESFPQEYPLRYLVAGGARLSRLPRKPLPFTLINGYGPTENTVFSTFYTVPAGTTEPPPIGVPIANVGCVVLDEHQQPVPAGSPGELYVSGANLARGYRNQPALTEAAFPVLRLGGGEPVRYYRTGDRVRLREDGNLEFIGRIDNQLKIRGYRVELGEIEAVLNRCPAVGTGVVVTKEVAGDRQLVAYYQPQGEGDGAQNGREAEVRDFLARYLPAYMIPMLVPLPRFPLTPNGKIDHEALPPPGAAASRTGAAASTPMEETVAEVWHHVLGVAEVFRHDHFFHLGGHSLNVIQVTARLRERLGRDIPVSLLFREPILAGYAAALEGCPAASTLPLLPRGTRSAPLTPGQRLLWTLQEMVPDCAAYNLPFAFAIHGQIDDPRLEEALRHTLASHPALRVRFVVEDGTVVQRLADRLSAVPLTHKNLHASSWEEGCPDLLCHLEEQAARPFDLLEGPPVRAGLYRVTPETIVLFLCVHHIVFDGWSINVFMRDLVARYDGADTSGAAGPAVSFLDFSRWQDSLLEMGVCQRHLDYWLPLLHDPPILDMTPDCPRPPRKSFQGGSEFLSLSKGLEVQLEELAAREGVTLFVLLLAAFSAFLHRYSGQEAMVIGVATAGRQEEALEEVVGYFVNVLPLTLTVAGEKGFDHHCVSVKETLVAAMDHQDLPLGVLLERLTQAAPPDRTPLFQALFSFVEYDGLPESIGGGAVDLLQVRAPGGKTDLALLVHRLPHGTRLELEYSADLFQRQTAVRMLANFHALLEAVVANPATAISRLGILAREELSLLERWNETSRPYPDNVFVHDLITEAAARNPEKVAVRDRHGCLSYGELERRANQCAWYFRRQGIAPGSIVGLCMPRCVDLFVVILGILKAGCAYLPMDEEWPAERRRLLLEDAAAVAVVYGDATEATAPPGTKIFRQSDLLHAMAGEPEVQLGIDGDAREALIYIIYTSGSTGKPKGVMVPHAAVVNMLMYMKELCELGTADCFLASSNLSFDISILEIFGSLFCGSEVYIATKEEILDGSNLLALLDHYKITFLQGTPSFLRILEQFDWPGSPRIQVLSGGEPLPPDLASFLVGRIAALWNGYGPTEATVYSTFYRVEAVEGRAVPIGWPVANTELYVLDAVGERVPIGVAGELCIGGRGVTRGYLNRPDLTAVTFVANPFTGTADARMYRTGDIVRFRHDGCLEFLCRRDHQVKIRGFRIEIGEIEACLNQCPQVNAGVVVVHQETGSGGQRLVAYYVPEHPGATGEVAAFLRQQLPAYMIPSLVEVAEFPTTSSGKIDRKALIPPEVPRLPCGKKPQTATEKIVAEVWEEVLGRSPIHREDGFFALGGTSLQAVRVLGLLLKYYRIDARINDMFQAKTLAEFAAALESMQAGMGAGEEPAGGRAAMQAFNPASLLLEIRRGTQGPPIFFVHPVGGTAHCYAQLAPYFPAEQPLMGIQAIGLDGRHFPPTSIETMARIYVEAVRGVQQSGPYFLVGWSLGGLVAYEMARIFKGRGEDVAKLVLVDAVGVDAVRVALIQRLDRWSWQKVARRLILLRKQLYDRLRRWRLKKQIKRKVVISYDDRMWLVSENNRIAAEKYRPGEYDGNMLLYCASQRDEGVTAGLLSSYWKLRVAGQLSVVVIHTGHIEIISNKEFAASLGRVFCGE